MEEDCLIGRKFVRSGSPCLHIFFYSFAVIRYISFMMGVFIKVSGWPGGREDAYVLYRVA